jgi:radical SAM protein with 4Fe4S-binding SPASM domain
MTRVDRAANALLNRREYSARQLLLSSMPTMLYVELTQNCNLHCFMCRSAGRYDATKDMDDRVFDRVADELMPFASIVDLRGWGESTILPNFERRVARARDTGARLRLVTNGLAMTPAIWRHYWECDGIIGVSIDAGTPELAAELGRGDLRRTLRHVREGADLRQAIGRGTLYFNTVVSAKNIEGLVDIVDAASAAGVATILLNPVRLRPGSPDALETVAASVPDRIARAVDYAAERHVSIALGAALPGVAIVHEALPTTCSNPWSHTVIAYNGDVIFCDHLIGHHEYALGNIAQQPFSAIWNGEKFMALRAAHIKAECSRAVDGFKKCTWCYANRYGEVEGPETAGGHRAVSAPSGLSLGLA